MNSVANMVIMDIAFPYDHNVAHQAHMLLLLTLGILGMNNLRYSARIWYFYQDKYLDIL